MSKGDSRTRQASRTGAQPTPPTRFSTDKTRAILREAMKLFLKRGYGAVSMNELIARVGGSKTTVYARYRNKAELFAATIDALLGELAEVNAAVDIAGLGVAEALTRIARTHLETATSERYVRLIRIVAAEAERFPELGRTFYEQGPARSYANFAAFLKRQHERGALAVEDPKLAADFFFGALLHRRLLARIYGVKSGPPRDTEAVAQEVVADFMAAYASRNGSAPRHPTHE